MSYTIYCPYWDHKYWHEDLLFRGYEKWVVLTYFGLISQCWKPVETHKFVWTHFANCVDNWKTMPWSLPSKRNINDSQVVVVLRWMKSWTLSCSPELADALCLVVSSSTLRAVITSAPALSTLRSPSGLVLPTQQAAGSVRRDAKQSDTLITRVAMLCIPHQPFRLFCLWLRYKNIR